MPINLHNKIEYLSTLYSTLYILIIRFKFNFDLFICSLHKYFIELSGLNNTFVTTGTQIALNNGGRKELITVTELFNVVKELTNSKAFG